MKTNASKTTGFTRIVMMTVAAIATASLTAVAASAAKPELNGHCVVAAVAASEVTAARISPANKTAGQEKSRTTTSKSDESCTTVNSALDASVLAPYRRWIEIDFTQAA